MCGRYALSLPPSIIRRHLQESHMPSQEAPDDDDLRPTYNFAPGYYGLVYRADVPDYGAGRHYRSEQDDREGDNGEAGKDDTGAVQATPEDGDAKEPQYKLQSMKWGLVPFWTKRNPDYGSMMRTINCRDDSLSTSGGMWNTMKQKKRCIVIAEGFYEWLKKNGGKEKIPHYVKRKDGQLMCLAGLWDCVKFEDKEEKLYTYTIITTDSNEQLKFLHDRMPVILNNGSADIFTWLDSNRAEWSKELQQLLKPYDGQLECYPVQKEVGKVGNNSPTFIVPIDSSENKQNIANFFGNQKKAASDGEVKKDIIKKEEKIEQDNGVIQHIEGEDRATTDQVEDGENNAPMPVASRKRDLDDQSPDDASTRSHKAFKATSSSSGTPKKPPAAHKKSTRSATSNSTNKKAGSPVKASNGSQKITSFFGT